MSDRFNKVIDDQNRTQTAGELRRQGQPKTTPPKPAPKRKLKVI